MAKEERKQRGVCMLPGVVTGVGEKDSKYQVTNNFIKTKQNPSCGA